MKNFLFYLFDTLILCPLAFAWSSVYRVRRYAYRFNFISSHRFKVPIISVGNISFGGTGKTPITMWLAEYFESQQKKDLNMKSLFKKSANKISTSDFL